MADTDHIDKPTTKRSIEIQGWQVEASKMIATIIIGLAIGYVRFATLENKVADHTLTIADMKTKVESAKDASSSLQGKMNTMDVQQALISGEFRDSLKRIEDDVKEVKSDLKNVKAGKPIP